MSVDERLQLVLIRVELERFRPGFEGFGGVPELVMAGAQVIQDVDVRPEPGQVGRIGGRGLLVFPQGMAGLAEQGQDLGQRGFVPRPGLEDVLDEAILFQAEKRLGIGHGHVGALGGLGVSLGQPGPGGLGVSQVQGLEAGRIEVVALA